MTHFFGKKVLKKPLKNNRNTLHVKIKYLLENNYSFQKKKKRMALFCIFASLLSARLIKNSWILIPASVFSMLQYVVWLKYMKKA